MAVHRWKRWLSALLVCALLAGGGAAYAETGSGGTGTDGQGDAAGQPAGTRSGFPDVPDNHWAKKHITKLRLQGIIQGTGTGKFNPSGNVSQQDAVLMAVRFIGAADKVDKNTQVLFPDTFIVSDYAKPYVMQAFYEGLIEENLEFLLAESDPNQPWGQKPATREWVTKLIIRAIGETERAEERALDIPAFSDAAEISDLYVGYVNAAVELGIVKGFSGDRFAPKNTITRAEFATMLSRAQYLYPVAFAGQYDGILTERSDARLVITGEDGTTRTIAIGQDTEFYRYDSELETLPSSLKPYTRVVVLTENGRARYVEQMDDNERLELTSGIIVTVDEGEHALYVKIGTRVLTIPYDSGVAVLDHGGAAVGLSALTENSEVDIYRETISEEKRAVRIELKSAPVNKQGQGTIVSVSPGAIEILDDGAEQPEKWSVAAAAAISRQGAPASLSDLRGGDIVSYVVENGVITRITVESSASRKVIGLFDGFSADRSSIIYVVNNRKEVSDLAAGAALEIPGFPAATWDDLYKDDRLELTLDGNDRVIAVKVVDRNITTVAGATIVSLADNLLTFRDQNGRPEAVELNKKTRIEVNNTELPLEAAKSLFVSGYKATITYSEDQAILVRFASSHTGTLTALDKSGLRMVLKLDDGSSVTIPYQSPSVQIRGKTGATLADLHAGDRVTVQLDQKLDKAIVVRVHQVVQMKVASVDASARKARLTTGGGVTSEYAIPADARILDEKGETIPLTQLAAGRTVNAEFAGSELVRLQLVIVKSGRILAASPGVVSLAEYGGSIQDIALGAQYRVVKNGTESTSTAVLSVGDRVEIRTDEKGDYVVTVIPALVKTFWQFDASTNEILVRRATVSEQNRYKMSADTLITSGGQAIAVTDLKADDRIALYILDGKLLEVEKLQ